MRNLLCVLMVGLALGCAAKKPVLFEEIPTPIAFEESDGILYVIAEPFCDKEPCLRIDGKLYVLKVKTQTATDWTGRYELAKWSYIAVREVDECPCK